MTRIVIALGIASLLGGCSVAYSSIRQEADGSYILTESKSRAFKVQGTMYKCTADGETMRCQVVALPKKR
jgi:hypothetical protein